MGKVRAKGRHHTAEMRDIDAEVAGDEAWLAHVADREPGPEEAAALLDLMEALVKGLDPFHARVLELLVEGYSVADIAQQATSNRRRER